MKNLLYCIPATAIIAAVLFSCAKDKATPDTTFTDAKLFALVTDSVNEKYYKDNSNATEWASTQGAHGNLIYKLKMNAKAFDACTASGKLPQGGSFPDSSLLVKKLFTGASTGSVAGYAVMYKLGGSWNWAEYSPTGTVLFSINTDNSLCVGCHQPNSRDFARTFDEHP
jgi:hypothetical protein